MGIFEINVAREAFAQSKTHEELGLEFRDSLNFLSVGYSNFIRDIAEKFINNAMVAPFTQAGVVGLAMKKMEAIPYASLDKFVIRTPEGVVGPMIPYLIVLDEAVDDLLNIKERLLEPLKLWLAKAISNPSFIEKAWLDKITFIDVEKHIVAIGKHYDDKVGDDISFTNITVAYPKPSDFATAGDMVKDISKESMVLLGKEIPKLNEEIASLVRKLVDANDKADYMSKAPKASMVKLSEVLYHTAREVELLSILLFQTKIVCVAYDESIKTINENL